MSEITKEQFINNYCSKSRMTREQFDKNLVALPCKCDSEDCKGWAAVFNDEMSVKIHFELYGP
jgi:hypothetical protein